MVCEDVVVVIVKGSIAKGGRRGLEYIAVM